MRCADCRLTWDANDPDPPECELNKQLDLPLVHPVPLTIYAHGDNVRPNRSAAVAPIVAPIVAPTRDFP